MSAADAPMRAAAIRLAKAYRLAEVVAGRALRGAVSPDIIMAALIVAAAILTNAEHKENPKC